MRRMTLHGVMACAMAFIISACDDDNFPPPGDGGPGEGVIADSGPGIDHQAGEDGASQEAGPPPSDAALADALPVDAALDGSAADGPVAVLDTGVPEAGWYYTEGGVVTVNDGGVVVEEDGGQVFICHPTKCSGKLLECGDCIDNDGDGFIDWRDPECLGPCDNTEGPGLESGVGGTTADVCGVDCYFDYGNGSGNDQCWWDHRCDILSPEVGCEYDAAFAQDQHKCPAEQKPKCAEYCLPYTPNGCDCFGCCTFPELTGAGADGSDVYVWIGNMDASNNSTCTLADLSDPAKCPPCTPVGNCLNECGRCEICVGKPTVPPDCYRTVPPDAGVPMTEAGVPIDADIPRTEAGVPIDAGVPMTEAGVPIDVGVPADGGLPPSDGGVIINPWQCDPGVQPCGLPGQAPCPETFYCISGCCKQAIL